MPKYVYASPIMPGKSQVVRQVYRQKREQPGQREQDAQVMKDYFGVDKFQAWLQRTPTKEYFIHFLDTKHYDGVFQAIQEQIQANNPKAIWWRDFYLETIGRDYGHSSVAPDIEALFNMDIQGQLPDRGEIISRGYVLPLKPTKLDAFREFCRQLMGEYRSRIQDSCRQFSVTTMSMFLQKSSTQDYIVIYQEKILLPLEQDKKPNEIRAQNPSYQWVSNNLMELTGLPFEQLEPSLEFLTPQPLATVHQGTSLVHAGR